MIFQILQGDLVSGINIHNGSCAVEKNHLYPSAPPLTRYKETTIPVMKKKLLECMPLDDNVYNKLSSLTIPRLCIRLNTLKVSEYIFFLYTHSFFTFFESDFCWNG